MKKSQVIWSDEAFVDLENIYDFLKVKSRAVAQRTVEDILSRSRQLEFFPESGTKQETMKTTIKKYPYIGEGNYKIIYRYQPESHSVYIAAVFDTRSNPEKLKV